MELVSTSGSQAIFFCLIFLIIYLSLWDLALFLLIDNNFLLLNYFLTRLFFNDFLFCLLVLVLLDRLNLLRGLKFCILIFYRSSFFFFCHLVVVLMFMPYC